MLWSLNSLQRCSPAHYPRHLRPLTPGAIFIVSTFQLRHSPGLFKSTISKEYQIEKKSVDITTLEWFPLTQPLSAVNLQVGPS